MSESCNQVALSARPNLQVRKLKQRFGTKNICDVSFWFEAEMNTSQHNGCKSAALRINQLCLGRGKMPALLGVILSKNGNTLGPKAAKFRTIITNAKR